MNTVSNLQKNVADIGQKCMSYGADKLYISGLIHITKVSHILLSQVNRKLRSICEENGF